MPEIGQVVYKGVCTGCGACEAICPFDAVRIEENAEIDYNECNDCYACQKVCPALHGFPVDEFDNVMETYAAKSDIPGQDGGTVSGIIASLFEQDLIDASVGVLRDEDWVPQPIITTSPEDVRRVAGTKYTSSPVVALLKEAIEEYERIAFVGVPCQVQAARLFQQTVSDRIELIVGLFCMESFTYDKLAKDFIPNELEIDVKDVRRMDITKGKFICHTQDGEQHGVPVRDIASYARSSCHHCKDFSSYHADISVGSVGAPDGWNAVLVRTYAGEHYFSKVKGDLEIDEANIEFVKKLAGMKHKNEEVTL